MNFKNILFFLFVLCSSITFSQYDPDYNMDDDEDLSQLAFKDRLYTGGNFWANFGTITNVELSPMLGYRVTKDYSVGVGAKYNFYRDNRIPFSTSIYGGSAFTRYSFFDKLVAHAEFEMLNLEVFRAAFPGERQWVPIGLVGGGYAANGFQIMALYDLIGDERNPYTGVFGVNSRLYLRVGFLFNL